jgi:co-chaperonin GroES (HSP10)
MSDNIYLKPQPGRCLVEREQAAKSAGLIYIPDKARVMPTIGTVVRVGDPDIPQYAELVGKRVLFSRMSGIPISIKNKPVYSLFAYEEILAIFETDENVEFETEDTSLMYQ